MIRQLSLLFLMCIPLLHGCSWKHHLNQFLDSDIEYRRVQPSEMFQREDSVLVENDSCYRLRIFHNDGYILGAAIRCPSGLQLDTTYSKNGHIVWARESQLASKNNQYLNDYSFTILYDKKNRPLTKTSSFYAPDTTWQYRQNYNEEGQLLPKKYPVIDELL